MLSHLQPSGSYFHCAEPSMRPEDKDALQGTQMPPATPRGSQQRGGGRTWVWSAKWQRGPRSHHLPQRDDHPVLELRHPLTQDRRNGSNGNRSFLGPHLCRRPGIRSITRAPLLCPRSLTVYLHLTLIPEVQSPEWPSLHRISQFPIGLGYWAKDSRGEGPSDSRAQTQSFLPLL